MGNKNNKSKALTMETAQSTTLKGAVILFYNLVLIRTQEK